VLAQLPDEATKGPNSPLTQAREDYKAQANKAGYLEASILDAVEMQPLDPNDAAFVALRREARERAAELGRKTGLPDEMIEQILAEVDEPGRLSDLVAGYVEIPFAERQELLETLSVEDRLRRRCCRR